MPATITLWGARASYVGPSLRLAPHRNSTATLVIGIEQAFRWRLTTAEAEYQSARLAVIPPGLDHHVIGYGQMAFVYLDAASDDWVRLQGALPTCEGWLLSQTQWDLPSLCGSLQLGHVPPDARLASLFNALHADPNAVPNVATAARLAGLSTSHLQRRFRAITGVSLRRYRAWRRLALAVRGIAHGATLTEAAHAAGFDSSSHFSTRFLDMFGVPPSQVFAPSAGTRFIEIETSDQ
jgi:AraC-like DNA-binding protein